MDTSPGFRTSRSNSRKTARSSTAEKAAIGWPFAQQGAGTDLVVISHGWNNDMKEARALSTMICSSNISTHCFAGRAQLKDASSRLSAYFGRRRNLPDDDLLPAEVQQTWLGIGRTIVPAALLKDKLTA